MSAFAGWLAFLMFVGAAKADATPEQAARLKSAVQPMIADLRAGGDPRPILAAVIEAMGPEWTPSGEWRAWIDSLTKEGE
jgi:hypothetical protein